MSYKTNFEKLFQELDREPDKNKLVSKNAGEAAKSLFAYLKSIYGKGVLAGQQYLQRPELEDRVYMNAAGRLPAVRGYDLMDMDKKKGDNQVARAIEWAKNTGCIITMCWHWYAPDDMENTDNCCWSFYYKTTSYKDKTSFDIIRAVTDGTPENDFVISRIDKAAATLKLFEAENIPVLWRPLHEANGSWFWWGNRGNDNGESADAYKKLWYMIFDRLENYHKLSNLIWVWNGQSREMAVNPNTFDICGEDIYPETYDHSSQADKFREVTSYTDGKMATLSECGYIPHPDALQQDNVKWLWWLPWWGQFVYEMDEKWHPVFDKNGEPVCNKKYMTEELVREIFENPYCITLDKLPFYKGEMYIKEKFGKNCNSNH